MRWNDSTANYLHLDLGKILQLKLRITRCILAKNIPSHGLASPARFRSVNYQWFESTPHGEGCYVADRVGKILAAICDIILPFKTWNAKRTTLAKSQRIEQNSTRINQPTHTKSVRNWNDCSSVLAGTVPPNYCSHLDYCSWVLLDSTTS